MVFEVREWTSKGKIVCVTGLDFKTAWEMRSDLASKFPERVFSIFKKKGVIK